MKPIYRGDNVPYTLSFKKTNGAPIDITNWKIFFTMKQHLSQSDNEAVIKKDIVTHDDPINGLSSIHLTNGETDDLIPGMYFYDFQVKKADGTILTLTVGQIQVLADVTRRES